MVPDDPGPDRLADRPADPKGDLDVRDAGHPERHRRRRGVGLGRDGRRPGRPQRDRERSRRSTRPPARSCGRSACRARQRVGERRLPGHRDRRRGGLGTQPEGHDLAHRPAERARHGRGQGGRLGTIAGGKEGVWFVDGNSVRQDRRADEPAGPDDRVRVDRARGHRGRRRLGLGHGRAPRVWSGAFEPGPDATAQSIDVGSGSGFIAFGAGAVWVANYTDGTVSRIDPRTNRVTSRRPIGPVQALAVGEGAAWVTVAGASRDGTLPASACSPIEAGAGTPDVIVASDLPLQGPDSAYPRAPPRVDPAGLPQALIPRGPVPGRLAVLRRLHRAERRVGTAPVRRQRERVRASEGPRRRDRSLQLRVRPVSARPPQPRAGRARPDRQSREHALRVHARGRAPARRLPRGARRLLPHRHAQLLPRGRPRAAAGRRAGDDGGPPRARPRVRAAGRLEQRGGPAWGRIYVVDPFLRAARRLRVGIAGRERYQGRREASTRSPPGSPARAPTAS